jgi:hypothetical protein
VGFHRQGYCASLNAQASLTHQCLFVEYGFTVFIRPGSFPRMYRFALPESAKVYLDFYGMGAKFLTFSATLRQAVTRS